MVKELSFQQIKDFFQKQFNMLVDKITKLDGYSSFVFKVSMNDGRLYILRQIISKEIDPFKHMQDNAEKILQKKYLYDQDNIQVEKFIVNVRLDIDKVFQNQNFKKLLRNVAKINKAKKLIKKYPNLMYIIENNKEYIFDRIKERTNQFEEPEKTKRIELFQHALEIYQVLLEDLQQEREMVLSHNDMFYYNFLYEIHREDFVIIDFEYAGYNPLGMDFMNLYNERLINYDKFEIEENMLPSDEETESHIRFFLYSYYYPEEAEELVKKNNFIELLENTQNYQNIQESQIQNIVKQLPTFGILHNLFWIFFYLQFPDIDIGLDLNKFLDLKKELLNKFYEQYKNGKK